MEVGAVEEPPYPKSVDAVDEPPYLKSEETADEPPYPKSPLNPRCLTGTQRGIIGASPAFTELIQQITYIYVQ